MLILAVDTATEVAGVAVARDTTLLAELSWRAAMNHSRQLPGAIEEVVRLAGVHLEDLTAVGVAIGPGSFSGVRVGMSLAMGLALAGSLPLVGIGTLDIIAYSASLCGYPVWPIVNAGRGQVFAARYVGAENGVTREGEYLLLTPDELVPQLHPGDIISTEDPTRLTLPPVLLKRVVPPPWRPRRAGFLAELARRYLEAGGEDQLSTVRPLYLRRTAAEEKRAT